MSFDSYIYLLFLPLVVGIHFLSPHGLRWAVLLIASYIFYMYWRPEYLLLILASTLIDYGAAIRISRSASDTARRTYLLASLVGNFGLLFAFKYASFLNESFRSFSGVLSIPYPLASFDLLLPVGISFYTFQSVSYTIDVYRGHLPPERHLGRFALYVSFFPQLVAGPIERAGRLLPQFTRLQTFEAWRALEGVQLILWGLFKKKAIADRIAVHVNQVYGNPAGFEAADLALATVLFGFQIYCDFSGYSDIAVGSARVLGYDLMSNFRAPYLACSIRDFWRRWHISLTSWFRDYVYLPLGGSRVSTRRWSLNVAIVFLLSGVWHGANWTFLGWGALHGVFLLVEHLARQLGHTRSYLRLSGPLGGVMKWSATFVLVNFAWILFRSPDLTTAVQIIERVISVEVLDWSQIIGGPDAVQRNTTIFLVGALMIIEAVNRRVPLRAFISRQSWPIQYAVCYVLIFGIWFLASARTPFIYFQF